MNVDLNKYRAGLFADRETVDEAMEYAYAVLNKIQDAHERLAAMTAMHVVLNTVINEVNGKEEN
jgi:hypothetical protein